MRISLSIVLFAVISSAFGCVIMRRGDPSSWEAVYENLDEILAGWYNRNNLKVTPVTIEEDLNLKTSLPVKGSAEPTTEPESEAEGFELIGTETILKKETPKLRKNEFGTEGIPAETFKIDSNFQLLGDITPVGKVILTEVGKKVTSAADDEIISRTRVLNSSENEPSAESILGGAFAGAVIDGGRLEE